MIEIEQLKFELWHYKTIIFAYIAYKKIISIIIAHTRVKILISNRFLKIPIIEMVKNLDF